MSRRVLRWGAAVLVLAGLWVLSQSAYLLPETQQALVVRLGRARALVTEPGIVWRLPLVDTVVFYDKRLLALDPPSVDVILGDRKRLEVEVYGAYRIVDPLVSFRASRSPEQGRLQLANIVTSATRRALGRVQIGDLLSQERERVMAGLRADAAETARSLGVELVELRLRRADLPRETRQAVYDRMKSERQKEAREVRAEGQAQAQEIQARAESERTVVLATATRQARIDRGEGDAEANRLYAQASADAPDFFDFYRTLQTYRSALSESTPTLILSPESRFLQLLSAGPSLPRPAPVPPAAPPAPAQTSER